MNDTEPVPEEAARLLHALQAHGSAGLPAAVDPKLVAGAQDAELRNDVAAARLEASRYARCRGEWGLRFTSWSATVPDDGPPVGAPLDAVHHHHAAGRAAQLVCPPSVVHHDHVALALHHRAVPRACELSDRGGGVGGRLLQDGRRCLLVWAINRRRPGNADTIPLVGVAVATLLRIKSTSTEFSTKAIPLSSTSRILIVVCLPTEFASTFQITYWASKSWSRKNVGSMVPTGSVTRGWPAST
mmetsp:Transcript_45125/g.144102  ORF Transcript_45125/g.144102 Transcript_45125/m.144102 type:complete len:243 (-) Transcript_45125:461-1189(-)